MSVFGMWQQGMRYWSGAARACLGDVGGVQQMASASVGYLAETADTAGNNLRAMKDSFDSTVGRPAVPALAQSVRDRGVPFALPHVDATPRRGGTTVLPTEQINVPVEVDVATLRRLVPPQLDITSFGRTVLVMAIASRFDLGPPLGVDKHYNEVAYAVPVSYQGEQGIFFLKLHLNWQEGVDVGRDHYGFPKELQQVSWRSERGRVGTAAVDDDGETLFALQGREVTGLLGGGLTAAQSSWIRELDRWATTCFFERDRQLVRGSGEFRTQNLRAFQVEQLDTPWLDDAGVRSGATWPAFIRTGTYALDDEVEVLEDL